MIRILDKMFENRKLSIAIPVAISALLYLLFIIFGTADDKMNIIIATPIAAVFWFFGAFLLVYIQVKNKRCPKGFLNFIEFFAALFFGIYSIISIISLLISGFQDFTPITSAGVLTYASISWAHSKRANNE